jgi:sugar phosphate isomerase/epimerase
MALSYPAMWDQPTNRTKHDPHSIYSVLVIPSRSNSLELFVPFPAQPMQKDAQTHTKGQLQMMNHVGVASSEAATAPRAVLWAAALRNKPLNERLDAARRAGFTHMSVFPIDMAVWRKELSDREIANAFRAAGVEVNTIDPYVQWTPGFDLTTPMDEATLAFINHDEDAIFAMAEALGAKQLNCVSWAQGPLDVTASADALRKVAKRASAAGMKITLEFMPISNIPDLRAALQILKAVDTTTLSLTFDTWHFFRSDPDLALLRTVDGTRILEVQLADAMHVLHGDLLNDLQHHRKVPGEGEFDIGAVTQVLREIGAWRSVGPEIFSDEMDGLSAVEAARHARAGLDRYAHEKVNTDPHDFDRATSLPSRQDRSAS